VKTWKKQTTLTIYGGVNEIGGNKILVEDRDTRVFNLALSELFISCFSRLLFVVVMDEKTVFYKGLYKVKVLTKSEGYWIVEALENFKDCSDGEGLTVKKGEQRIVALDALFEKKTLPPMVKEHDYELKMEKKLKHLIDKEENVKK